MHDEGLWEVTDSASWRTPTLLTSISGDIEIATCVEIVEGPIAFIALQDAPPSFARAWVGYLARSEQLERAAITERVRELSKLHRPTLVLAQEIATDLAKTRGIFGVAICVQSLHLSPRRRNAENEPPASFAWRGLYNWRPVLRRRFAERCGCESG